MSELKFFIENIRRIHESAMSEFEPNDSIFDRLTEEEMWLLFLLLNQSEDERRRRAMKEFDILLTMDQIPAGTAQMKRANFRNGTFFEGQKLKEARKFYSEALAPFVPSNPLDGPIAVSLSFCYAIKDKKKKGKWKTTKPDCDNLVKLILDCMTNLGFWHDDAQIARLVIRKTYSCKDRAEIFCIINEMAE